MEKEEFKISEYVLATQGQRLLNNVIDVIVIYFLIFCFGIIAAIFAQLTGSQGLMIWLTSMDQLDGYIVFIAIMFLYYFVFENLLSRTIAKYITKTIVVHEDGSKPESAAILKRTLSRFVPFDNFSFLGGSGIGWHDRWSDTYVVKKEGLDQEKDQFHAFNEIGKIEE